MRILIPKIFQRLTIAFVLLYEYELSMLQKLHDSFLDTEKEDHTLPLRGGPPKMNSRKLKLWG